MARDLDDVLKALDQQGFHYSRTRRGHWMVRDPTDNRVITTISGTGTPQALRNALAQLRAAGFQWPPTRR